MMPFSVLGVVVLLMATGLMGWLALRVCLRIWRARRDHSYAALRGLWAQHALPDSRVCGRVLPVLHGTVNGYAMSVEHGKNHRDRTRHMWRVHARLDRGWPGRIVLHGEERPGNMRALSGLEVVLSGVEAFDHVVLLASDYSARAEELLNDAFQKRFVQQVCSHFQIDILKRSVYAEFSSRAGHDVEDVRAFTELLGFTMAAIDHQ